MRVPGVAWSGWLEPNVYQGIPCLIVPDISRTPRGYGQCQVKRYGVVVHRRHRLAWIDAHGMLPPPETPWILHYCDVPECEEPTHLYAGTPGDNIRDMWARSGRKGKAGGTGGSNRVPGEDRPNHRLTAERVRTARRDHAAGVTIADLARRYGVSRPTLRHAVQGATWKHVE
jgi:hypothetical protein